MIENLRSMQENGIEAFISEQVERWKCETCGEAICCHYGLCLACDLNTLRENKKYRWGE
jgi:hypothetical protein